LSKVFLLYSYLEERKFERTRQLTAVSVRAKHRYALLQKLEKHKYQWISCLKKLSNIITFQIRTVCLRFRNFKKINKASEIEFTSTNFLFFGISYNICVTVHEYANITKSVAQSIEHIIHFDRVVFNGEMFWKLIFHTTTRTRISCRTVRYTIKNNSMLRVTRNDMFHAHCRKKKTMTR